MNPDRTAEVTHFHEHAKWVGVHDDDRKAWLTERQKLITASRMPALFGLSPFEDALAVYVDLVASQQPVNDVELSMQDPRFWGKVLERPIAEAAAKRFGWELQMSGALLVSRRYPFIGCTQDAELKETSSGAWLSYEGKTTGWMHFRDWDEETGLPPDHVLLQVQTQQLVTNAPASLVCCLIGGNRFSKIRVEPNRDLQNAIIEVSEDMMERVRSLDPPPPTWRSKDAIIKLYPGETGEIVQMTAEAAEYTLEIAQIDERKKVDKMREDELKNLLRMSMGEATFGVLPVMIDGKQKQWKRSQIEVGEHIVSASVQNRFQLVNVPTEKGKKTRKTSDTTEATVSADNEANGRIILSGRKRSKR